MAGEGDTTPHGPQIRGSGGGRGFGGSEERMSWGICKRDRVQHCSREKEDGKSCGCRDSEDYNTF